MKSKTTLRENFGSGAFMLSSKVQGAALTNYYKYLKRQYSATSRSRNVYAAKYSGHQGMNYWVLLDRLWPVDNDLLQIVEISPYIYSFFCVF